MNKALLVAGLIALMSGCQSASEDSRVTISKNTPLVSPAPIIKKKSISSNAPLKPQFITLEEREKKYINEALEMMGNSNPGFKKDMVDDDYRLEMVQDSLHKPIELVDGCDMLDEKWRQTETMADALQIQIGQLGKWWVISPTETTPPKTPGRAYGRPGIDVTYIINKSPQEFQPVIKRLLLAIEESRLLLDRAFKDLPPEYRK